MKVASVQMAVDDGDKENNISRAKSLLSQAKDADLVLLPELWNIGYFSFNHYKEAAETLDGKTVSVFKEEAEKFDAYILMGSIIENDGPHLFNTSVLLNPKGEIETTYRKTHLFKYQSQERKLLQPGKDLGVAETDLGVFGLATCYDLRFPELFAELVRRNTVCFLVASAWPYPRLEHWKLLNRVRALENLSFLVSSNCVGSNRDNRFVGHSMIVDPWGVPVEIGNDKETIISAEIDLSSVEQTREGFSALEDRLSTYYFD